MGGFISVPKFEEITDAGWEAPKRMPATFWFAFPFALVISAIMIGTSFGMTTEDGLFQFLFGAGLLIFMLVVGLVALFRYKSSRLTLYPDRVEVAASKIGNSPLTYRRFESVHFNQQTVVIVGQGATRFAAQYIADPAGVVELLRGIVASLPSNQDSGQADPASGSLAAELERLADLKSRGLLSESQYQAAVSSILGQKG